MDTKGVLELTGLASLEEVIDMANLGSSLLNAIETVTGEEGAFENWTPAEDPAEIVLDLYGALEEAKAGLSTDRADLSRPVVVQDRSL